MSYNISIDIVKERYNIQLTNQLLGTIWNDNRCFTNNYNNKNQSYNYDLLVKTIKSNYFPTCGRKLL